MADEVIKIIKIETGGSEQTVKGLKEEISSLRDALLNVEKGSEEYKNILDQLIDDQKRLTDVMNAGVKEAKAAEGSYNALVNQMAALKKVWRETTDEASKKALGKQIKELNDKLKEADASIGNYQRNVGNYTQSVTAAFGSMGGAAKGMIGPINGVKQAFNALAAHPIVAVLTALAALLINGIAKGFKNSEEASNKMKVSFAALQGIADAVSKAFEKVALWIANVTEKAVALLDKLHLLSPELKKSMEDRKKIAEDEIKLDDKRRDNIKKNADLERDAAELRAKAADKDKYTAQERLAFLEQAEQKEQEIAANEIESLQLEYDIAKAKLEINKDNADLKQAEADAYAKLTAAQTAYAQKVQSSRKAISRTRQEMVRDARQAEQALLNLQKDLIQQEYDLAVDGSEDQLRLAKELARKDLEIKKSALKEKIKDQKDYNKALELLMKQHNKDIEKLEYEHENKRIERMEQKLDLDAEEIFDAVEKAAKKLDNAETILEEKKKQLETIKDKTSQEYTELEMDIRRRQISLKELQDGLQEAIAREVEIEVQYVLDTTMPLSDAYAKISSTLQTRLNTLKQLNGESDKEFAIRKKELQKRVNEYNDLWKETAILERELAARFTKLDNLYKKYLSYNSEETPLFSFQLRDSVEEGLEEVEVTLLNKLASIKSSIGRYINENSDSLAETLSKQLKTFTKSLAPDDPLRDYWRQFFGVENLDEVTGEVLRKVIKIPEKFEEIRNELVTRGLIPQELVTAYNDTIQEMADNTGAKLDVIYDKWSRFAQSIGKLFNGIGAIYEADLEGQKKRLVESKKYGEQERKMLEDQYDRVVKPIKIAEATISTIQGALDAFMSAQDLKWPMGPIVGGIMAAATTALGIAEIMKIKQTNPYESSGGGLSSGSFQMAATVPPTVTDFNPEYTTNLTGRSDTDYLNEALGNQRLFVSVVDINDAQERGRVRVAESSF